MGLRRTIRFDSSIVRRFRFAIAAGSAPQARAADPGPTDSRAADAGAADARAAYTGSADARAADAGAASIGPIRAAAQRGLKQDLLEGTRLHVQAKREIAFLVFPVAQVA